MVIRVDIDGTICKMPEIEGDYTNSIPIRKNIRKINKLYDKGNVIIYWTARGSKTGIDWKNTTKKQLKKWGVKYHALEFGKPFYDLYIDDKSIRIEEV